MINILSVILPAFVLLGLGVLARKVNLLNHNGAGCIKEIICKIILPAAIFNALLQVDYSTGTVFIVLIMLGVILVTFALGFAAKKFTKSKFRKYLPFMVSVYEGGMIAYPLFCNLCGEEQLAQIALLDIAGLLFGFSVYMGMLQLTDKGEKINVPILCKNAFKSPDFCSYGFRGNRGNRTITYAFVRKWDYTNL